MWEQENRVLYGDFAGVIEGNADVAGYSGAPLAKKLGLKAGNRIAVIGAPLSFLETLGEIPPDVSISTDLRCRGAFDLILFFAPDLTSLRVLCTASRTSDAGRRSLGRLAQEGVRRNDRPDRRRGPGIRSERRPRR